MQRRWLVRGGFLVASACAPTLALAAEITDVADAADMIHIGSLERDDIWDLYLDDEVEMLLENGKITREPIARAGVDNGCTADDPRRCEPVDELRYVRNTTAYRLRGQIGIYQDLALTFGWSYVIDQQLKFRFARGVTEATSTVQSSDPAIGTLFRKDFQSHHAGSGNIDLGLKFAPLSDERDDSKPSWVVAVNWSAPWTNDRYDPEVRATESSPGSVGDGVHRLTFSTALSKRLGAFGLIAIDPNSNRRGFLDPYVELAYVLPIPQRGRALDALVPSKSNAFKRSPSHVGKLNLGVEVVPLEDLKNNRKIAVDLGLRTAYYSEGRNYSELTDALGRLTYTEQYFYVGGVIAIYAQVAEFLRLKAGVGLGYNTEHFLTNEDVGKDLNGDGQVTLPDGDDTTIDDLINPYYCGNDPDDVCQGMNSTGTQYSFDQVGFRFKDEEHVLFNAFLSAMFTF